MTTREDLLTKNGALLYHELPEEYRYRDTGPDGDLKDLEAYLHGFGHMLDLVRGTIEQAHADSFAEKLEDGRSIQPWLIPYLAELVGAELLAPDPEQRVKELNNSVQWTKSKGTLHNVDQVADVVAGSETVAREGWRATLTCPRPSLPPFSVPATDEEGEQLGRSVRPGGCPDFRKLNRAVQDPSGSNPLYRLRYNSRDQNGITSELTEDVYWKHSNLRGVPCFPGHYDDNAARCPDLRDPDIQPDLGPHPRRTHVHVRTPDGLFDPTLLKVVMADPAVLQIKKTDTNREIGPAEVMEAAGIEGPEPDRIVLELGSRINIPRDAHIKFRNILFTRSFAATGEPPSPLLRVVGGGRVSLDGCSVDMVSLPGAGNNDSDAPVLTGQNSIFDWIVAPNRFVELVYCTVMQEADVDRLHASDCIFIGLSSNLNCNAGRSCIRFSRLVVKGAKAEKCFGKATPSNTQAPARFVLRYFRDTAGKACTLRTAKYGEPGYGVLDITTRKVISQGAEDEGEMGAHHAHFLAAQLRALQKKLTRFLPLGQEIVTRYDPLLALTPPELTVSETD